MQRKTYVIEAENGVGLYLSQSLMEKSFRYLSSFNRCILPFDTFEAAKNYIFKTYKQDMEIDLSKFKINYTIMRDTSQRFCFFVQSKNVIGYGIHKEKQKHFQHVLHVSRDDIIEVTSKLEAEQGARSGFVEEYGNPAFYYGGILLPGESVSFSEMLKSNGIIDNYPETVLKLHGCL